MKKISILPIYSKIEIFDFLRFEKSIFGAEIPILKIPCFGSEGKGRITPCYAEQIFFAFLRVLMQFKIRNNRFLNGFMKSFSRINGCGNEKTVPKTAPENSVGVGFGTR